jgi:hypothetical protein
VFFHWQERHAHAIGTGLGQIESQLSALALKELVWDLEENAGAVAGLGIAPAGSAVRQVQQNLDSFGYDVVALMASYVRYKSNTAGVMLLRRMV